MHYKGMLLEEEPMKKLGGENFDDIGLH